MADLTGLQATEATRVVGSTASGVETNPLNVTTVGDAQVVDKSDTSYVSLRFTVTTTEVEAKVGGSALSGRKELVIFNDGNKDLYYGPTGVTSSGSTKGILIPSGGDARLPYGENVQVFLISVAGGTDVIVQETA